MKHITIKNARLHNLKNIDISIPKDSFVVVTGVSGSGKSSFVFDLLYEEGRKNYLKSLGIYQDIEDENEWFDSIHGISPTVAVKQKIISENNPRSVVGTKTRILEYLRMLYSIYGDKVCSRCGELCSKDMICTKCGNVEERLSTQYFSFNTPVGMCLKCKGRGIITDVCISKIVPEDNMPLRQILKRVEMSAHRIKNELEPLLAKEGVDLNTPYGALTREVQRAFIYGIHDKNSKYRFFGVVPFILWKKENGRQVNDFVDVLICPDCYGYRIGKEGLEYFINQNHIGQLASFTIMELKHFIEEYVEEYNLPVYIRSLFAIIQKKIQNLIDVGLSYLSLYREIPTLSGGELQRLFLMSHLESRMESIVYIFDEPTTGLHEIEKKELLNKIKALQSLGNSIIIVEHDKNTIEMAEHIIDFGPLAGKYGGDVVYQGGYHGLLSSERSITGQYLSGRLSYPSKTKEQYIEITDKTPKLNIKNAVVNNLKNIDVEIPLRVIVGIAGVSGSGKSSLISDSLVPLLKEHFKESVNYNGEDEVDESEDKDLLLRKVSGNIYGTENLAGIAEISQSPIGRNRRSVVITYLGIWNKIRNLFANQPLAKKIGLTPGHFSFNSQGACALCKGLGIVEKSFEYLGVITRNCPECSGKRYHKEILSVTYKEKNILDIMDMSVSEAMNFFKEDPSIALMLSVLTETGVGYIQLGQPTPTLSGGEAQRIKIARELGKERTGNILFVMDEPTTGLSYYDTAKLIDIMDKLIKKGGSVIVIEHDPTVLSYCDWIIEMGPKSGSEGGDVIAQGTPFSLKNNVKSRIGPFLTV